MASDDQFIEIVLEDIEALEEIPEGWEKDDDFLEKFDVRFEPERSIMFDAIRKKKKELDGKQVTDNLKATLDRIEDRLDRIESKLD